MQRFRSTFSVQFYCRKSKAKAGLAPIEAGVNINGSRFFYNLPRKARPGSYLKTEAEYLYAIEQSIRRYEIECLEDNEPLSVDGIKEYIRNGYTRPGKTIGHLVQSFYAHLEERVKAGLLIESGYRKYRTAIGLFLSELDQGKPVAAISPGYCVRFALKIDGKYENSTGAGMKTKVKSLLNYAVMNNYVKVSPWQEKISKKVKKVEIPTEDEFKRFLELDLSFNPSLERARDLWIFASGSGLAYCDCASVVPGDIMEKDGIYYINKNRGKTDVEFFAVLLPWAVDIYKKYGGLPKMISNQKVNAYIKVVGEMAGLQTSLHFHLARHYYCHMLLNKYKVAYDVAAKMMGHKTISMTARYGQIWGKTILDTFGNNQ